MAKELVQPMIPVHDPSLKLAFSLKLSARELVQPGTLNVKQKTESKPVFAKESYSR